MEEMNVKLMNLTTKILSKNSKSFMTSAVAPLEDLPYKGWSEKNEAK